MKTSDYARRIIKRAVCALFLGSTISGAAFAQDVAHGTFFVLAFSREYAVVAIDSREIFAAADDESDRYDDRICKIRPLSPSAFFVIGGFIRAVVLKTARRVPKAALFDARDLAQDVYERSDDVRKFDDLADKWALRMEGAMSKVRLAPLAKQVTTRGYFVGTSGDGEIEIAEAAIDYHADAARHFAHTLQRLTPTATPNTWQVADKPMIDIEQEFANGGKTERARKIIRDDNWFKIVPDSDAWAVRVTDLVAAVRDWSGNKRIGGDIATIILERGKNWRWFHRPDFCPQK